MEPVDFKRAYYIKLGKKGKYEQSAISESKLIIGYGGQSLQDINRGNWGKIGEQLGQASKSKKGVATRDLNVLRIVCESTFKDLWITFFQGAMWWCRLGPREVFQGDKSKYRLVEGKWSNRDVCGNPLEINSIPGVLSKIQGFRGTVCKVRALETLRQLMNSKSSLEYNEIEECKISLIGSVEKGIKKLHWKDFETFVDLVFRVSGWRRLSMVGGPMKFTDLELEDPITKDQYQVQIKSQATWSDFDGYTKQFNRQLHRKLYFVVHTPDKKLAALQELPQDIELILPGRLSEMVVRLGLVDWLMSHIK
jgi:hypothetical protein